MRNVVLAVGMSLDSYIARPDGSVDFLFMPPDFYPSMEDFATTIDTTVMGRKTCEVSLKLGGAPSETGWTTYVYSRSVTGAPYINVAPAEWVAAMRKQDGKDIWLMGGGELAAQFLKEDLVDEIIWGSCRC